MGVYIGYNHLNMRWSFPKRIAFLSIYFLGYFSLFILYGNRLMYDDFTMDKI